MREEMIARIVDRLTAEKARLAAGFRSPQPPIRTRHFVLDDLLSEEVSRSIYAAFPTDRAAFREIKSFRERKVTSKNLDEYPKILTDITFAIQSRAVVDIVGEITGIRQQRPDPLLYAGGLSMMMRGDYLHPHIDNSHDKDRQLYRTVNLLYYVTPDWRLEDGGNLELWDAAVRTPLVLHSRFNRLVVMATDRGSWHSVNPVHSDGRRCCVSNYYFSPISPEGEDYFHVTSFAARPEEGAKQLLFAADNAARSFARKIRPRGFGREDVYRG
jgi:Rps23 Pro-64 3,4-dihydroxylase Tpa1-like proline 4-hydroxylase